MTLAWLTSMTGDRYNLDLLTSAVVRQEPTTGTWLLRVAAQDGGMPVTMVADPRESVVLAGLGALLVRGWVPVVPDEYAASGAAVNPRALAVVDYRRKPHDWMDGWAEQTAEQRAGHQLGDPERAEEWEVVLHSTDGAAQRLSWPYPAYLAAADDAPSEPLATEPDARVAVRRVTDHIAERLAHGPPWSDPDYSDPLWITRAPE